MTTTIDYQKSVDVIDQGILALNRFKRTTTFDIELKNNISSILDFFSCAKKPEYEKLLFDKHISINKAHLESIHSKINEINFPEETIQKAIVLLKKVGTKENPSEEEINLLQDYLFEVSKPIWVSLNFSN